MPSGDNILYNQMLLDETVTLRGENMIADLTMFDISDFDVILGIDFLSQYGAKIDCRKKKVRFHLDNGKQFTFGQDQVQSMMINDIKAKKLLSESYTGYLQNITSKFDDLVPSLQSTLIVCEFQDMFLDKLSRLASKREMEFNIELAPEITPISNAPYRIAPIKL